MRGRQRPGMPPMPDGFLKAVRALWIAGREVRIVPDTVIEVRRFDPPKVEKDGSHTHIEETIEGARLEVRHVRTVEGKIERRGYGHDLRVLFADVREWDRWIAHAIDMTEIDGC